MDRVSDNEVFERAADRVARRILLRRWVGVLRRSALGVVILALLILIFGAPWWGWVAVLVGWVAVTGGLVWEKRPSRFAALAHWDEAAGHREAFCSALALRGNSAAEVLHRERVGAQIPEALRGLSRDLPIGFRWADFGYGVLVLGVIGGVLLALPHYNKGASRLPGEEEMGAEMQNAVAEEGQELMERGELGFNEEVLTAEEEEAVKELEREIAQLGEELATASSATAREVLAALEEKARAAEELAEQLGASEDGWASEKMIAALKGHLDTEALGVGVEKKGAESVSQEARQMAGVLRSEGLLRDVEERFRETFENVLSASEEETGGLVGEVVVEVSDFLTGREPVMAANLLEKLADQMKREGQREEAQEALENLAEELRESGSEIANQGEAGGSPEGGANGASPSQGISGIAEDNAFSSVAPPGFQQGGGGSEGELSNAPPQMQAPVPGTSQDGGGSGEEAASQAPMMMAPVPGQTGEPNGQMTMTVPGSGQGQPQPGQGRAGGDRAGQGTSDWRGEPTDPATAATKDEVVAGMQGSDGASTMRAVAGGEKDEQSERSPSAMAVEFLRVEEAALDEAQLPLSRRRQVLRYFTGLRETFEKQTSSEKDE